ncbi:uridine kinase [Tessaracoccus sp. MC1865]|nr:uridine kinase [Tessaracoccus sp. MC1865]
MSLDDFYRDLGHPGLPMTPMGIPDWDDVACWDMELAVDTLRTLLRDGRAELPVYDISLSRRVGTRTVDLGTAQIVLAEGIFAIQALAAARAEGLTVEALWLDRRRAANFLRRLARDLKEHRKPPAVLLHRGWALYRSEPALRRAALAAGFRGMSMRRALGSVKRR